MAGRGKIALPRRVGNGRWGGKITFNRRQYWVGTFDTPNEWRLAAARLLAKLQQEAEHAEGNERRRTRTVAEFVGAGWPRSHASRRTKESTFRNYEYMVRQLVAAFGDRPLRGGIGRAEARAWATSVSANAVHTARALFYDAIEDELADVNPFASLRLPTKLGRKDITVLDREEFEQLCQIPLGIWPDGYGEVLSAFIRWQGETGMRPGETMATRWSFVDFDRNRITVLLQRDSAQGETKPKIVETEIVLPPRVKAAVLAMPRLHRTLIFPALQGGPMTKSACFFYWEQIRAAFLQTLPPDHWLRLRTAKGKRLNLYELRHYAATWLLEPPPHGLGLTPFDVAQQLGHTDRGIRVTKLYGHPDARRAQLRLEEALRRDEDIQRRGPERLGGRDVSPPDAAGVVEEGAT